MWCVFLSFWYVKQNQMKYKLNFIFFCANMWMWGKGGRKSIFRTHISLTLMDSGTGLGPELKLVMNRFSLLQLSTVCPCWDLTSLWAGKAFSIPCLSLTSPHSKWAAVWSSYSTIQAITLYKQWISFHWDSSHFRHAAPYSLQLLRFKGTWIGRICTAFYFFYIKLALYLYLTIF